LEGLSISDGWQRRLSIGFHGCELAYGPNLNILEALGAHGDKRGVLPIRSTHIQRRVGVSLQLLGSQGTERIGRGENVCLGRGGCGFNEVGGGKVLFARL
jgi:hypothetical protein